MKVMKKIRKKHPINQRWALKLSAVIALSGVLTPVSQANVVGSDMQNFNATTSGLDFVTVESSETLEPGFFNFGFFMNYAVNTLPYFETTDTIQSRTKFNDTLIGADLNLGYGVARNLDLGLSLPQVVTSSLKTKSWNGTFRDNGNTEVRLNAKYRLLGDKDSGVAIQGVVNLNRTKDNPYVGKTNAPIYSVVLIGNRQLNNDIGMGINLGYRWRKAGDAIPESDPIKPLPNQIIWSAAVNYRLESIDSKLVAEIFGSNPQGSVSKNGDRTASSSELTLGIKRDLDTNLAIHGGVGTELAKGLSSPDWRLYAGLNYAIGPTFSQPVRATRKDPPETVSVKNPFDTEPKTYEKIVVHDIMFEFDSDSQVLGKSKEMLAQLAEHLKKSTGFTKLVVVGHTDSLGNNGYNDALSKRRAETVKRWLVTDQKIDGSKIETEGKGEMEPVASNGNYQGRQLNRRVEFRIYRTEQAKEERSLSNPKDAEGAVDPGEKPILKQKPHKNDPASSSKKKPAKHNSKIKK
jgi:outer membrane protein OmpA-like peptidoglycan-associated protein